MEVPTSQSSGQAEHTEVEYFDWNPEGSAVAIRMHPDVIDAITREVVEGFRTLTEGHLETGGLLLGRVESGEPLTVWIERCQTVPCRHRLGPKFILDPDDQAGLVAAAEQTLKTTDLSVVGLYRSHRREGLQLEISDFELIGRYFSDPSDLMLLVKPEGKTAISGRFFRREADGGAQPVGPAFPFGEQALSEMTGRSVSAGGHIAGIVSVALDAPEPPRRLVPDFIPSIVEPSRTPRPELASLPEKPAAVRREKNLMPLLAAICLVAGGAWFFLQPKLRLPGNNTPVATTSAPDRPLGLYVDPAADMWRVSWNPNATALHNARLVQLFVREGDDQKRFDLSPDDLASGMYQYQPTGKDVTFRLEVTENSGRVTAESFRVTRAASPAQTLVAVPAVSAPPVTPKPSPAAARITEPRAISKVPPVVPLSIKPRIKDAIPIDVRVHIDAEGRVTSAAPVVKQPSGLHAYLAGRAVEAARRWRFEPARQNGRPVPGTETIHFVFEN